MANTFSGWWRPVRLLVLFYLLFILMALISDDHGRDPALMVWRFSIGLSATMALIGVLGSWQVVAYNRGRNIYPLLEYSGVWSMIAIEAYHAFYVGPAMILLHGDSSMGGRSVVHMALALAICLIARRKRRFKRDAQ